ncbi:hypothetical protein ACM9HF_06605 [Colwellia sp. RE-S-Sl-9]
MTKLLSRLLACCLALLVFTQVNAKELIDDFKIEEGVASFTQEKKFSFLSTPIKSSGLFKVYKHNILWQVNSPVFSKLLIIDNEIWQYNEVKTIDGIANHYRKMVTHASIETLIQTVFTGTINEEQWDTTVKNEQCLLLQPKDTLLAQAISLLELCLGEEESEREVLITDTQKNTTKIVLTQTKNTLSDEDINEFNIH